MVNWTAARQFDTITRRTATKQEWQQPQQPQIATDCDRLRPSATNCDRVRPSATERDRDRVQTSVNECERARASASECSRVSECERVRASANKDGGNDKEDGVGRTFMPTRPRALPTARLHACVFLNEQDQCMLTEHWANLARSVIAHIDSAAEARVTPPTTKACGDAEDECEGNSHKDGAGCYTAALKLKGVGGNCNTGPIWTLMCRKSFCMILVWLCGCCLWAQALSPSLWARL